MFKLLLSSLSQIFMLKIESPRKLANINPSGSWIEND